MGRRESPVPEVPLHDFAQGLRDLRAAAGAPTYREPARRARYSPSALSDAAAGRRLPTLDVTLALAAALGGDVDVWRARWEELDARLRSTHPELVAAAEESEDDMSAGQPAPGLAEGRQHTADDGPAAGSAAGADPRPVIRQLVQAGELRRAAEAAEGWEQHAVRAYGTDSAEAAGRAEIRADVARAAGDMGQATLGWLTAAGRHLAGGSPDGMTAAAAARSAHWCWERVEDPVEARALGEELVTLLRRVPGLDPRHLPAARERLRALSGGGLHAAVRARPALTTRMPVRRHHCGDRSPRPARTRTGLTPAPFPALAPVRRPLLPPST